MKRLGSRLSFLGFMIFWRFWRGFIFGFKRSRGRMRSRGFFVGEIFEKILGLGEFRQWAVFFYVFFFLDIVLLF
jgi:hypothetical protein